MKTNSISQELGKKIISVAYGDSNPIDWIKIHWLSLTNSDIRKSLKEYKNTAFELRKLELENCPDDVIKSAKKKLDFYKGKNSILDSIFEFISVRPVISSTAFICILLALISLFVVRKPEVEMNYTQEEVLVAEKQVEETFQLISKLLIKTQNKVETEVLNKRVSEPIKKSIDIISNYIKEK